MKRASRSLALSGAILFVLISLSFPSSARAEAFAGDVPDRVWIDLGGAFNELATQVGVTGPSGLGTAIDMEDTFELPGDRTTFQIMGTVRVSEKRRWVDFGYVNIDRSGTSVINEDINFGDYTFLADGTVTAAFNTRLIYGAFRYDFLHEEKIRISGSAGLSYTELKASLAATGDVVPPEGGPPIAGNVEKDGSIALPVPLVGLNVDWALTRRLVLKSYNRFFKLKAAGIDGGMYENGIHLNWYFVKNFGLGLGFDRTEIKLKEVKLSDDRTGKFDYIVSGVGLYANLAF